MIKTARTLLMLGVLTAAHPAIARMISIEDRVVAQRAIEEVYWRHRIWPADNPGRKPGLDAVMSADALRARVEDTLKKSSALETLWHRPITGEQLQAELDRMAHASRDPKLLQELFDALNGDATLIAEALVRPLLVDRLIRNWSATAAAAKPFEEWWNEQRPSLSTSVDVPMERFVLPSLPLTACTNDTWSATLTETPDARWGHTAVWTGTEMIVWGGSSSGHRLNTGGRYNPATDTWTPTSTGLDAPLSRVSHTAIWTGTEMVVWGGAHLDYATGSQVYPGAGARYDPANDSWTPTSTGANAIPGRANHTAVWTGTEMIVWGGWAPGIPNPPGGGRYRPASDTWVPIATANSAQRSFLHSAIWTGTAMIVWGGSSDSTGGRYDPATDSWTPTSIGPDAPSPRGGHAATWTGTEMIVWGGRAWTSGPLLSTGARYDPLTDAWSPTSNGSNAPSPRDAHTAAWTGSKMIVWGGTGGSDGAAYDPSTDAWTATAATALTPRSWHTAVWTGTEMIVWGGKTTGTTSDAGHDTGARFDPASDSWVATSRGASAPTGRQHHTAVWTGTEMIVWGGHATTEAGGGPRLNTGGRYSPATDTWTPTSLGVGVVPPRSHHAAVWTGSQMIVWGGTNGPTWFNTGARYDPIADSWVAISTGANVPAGLSRVSAVWTGHEILVWGLLGSTPAGGRYDPGTNTWRTMSAAPNAPKPASESPNLWTGSELIVWGVAPMGGRYSPSTDSWAPISTGANAPSPHYGFAAAWTGTEVIFWGGCCETNTGGRYNPATDSWLPTSTGANSPSVRQLASGVWTGSEMIVWGGVTVNQPTYSMNAGGRYDPASDSWMPISMGPDFPSSRYYHTAIWTGTEMIVWGGEPGTATGGRYCACPSGQLAYRDADGDGHGDAGASIGNCNGSAPPGYVLDHGDCNDAIASTPSDSDDDGIGDACDLDDGLIYQWRSDKTSVSWQAEQGQSAWSVYIGDLDVLKSTGVYTQPPGSNALAARQCGVPGTVASDTATPAPGNASFSLVAGVTGGVEGSLGESSAGPRPNANPCP